MVTIPRSSMVLSLLGCSTVSETKASSVCEFTMSLMLSATVRFMSMASTVLGNSFSSASSADGLVGVHHDELLHVQHTDDVLALLVVDGDTTVALLEDLHASDGIEDGGVGQHVDVRQLVVVMHDGFSVHHQRSRIVLMVSFLKSEQSLYSSNIVYSW